MSKADELDRKLQMIAIVGADGWYEKLPPIEQYYVKELARRVMCQGIVMFAGGDRRGLDTFPDAWAKVVTGKSKTMEEVLGQETAADE